MRADRLASELDVRDVELRVSSEGGLVECAVAREV